MVVVKLLQRSGPMYGVRNAKIRFNLNRQKTTEYGKSCHKFVKKKKLIAIVFFFCKINSHSHSTLDATFLQLLFHARAFG